MVTSVPSDSLATSIMSEAKSASRNIDMKLLTQQEVSTYQDINYNLNESNFYSRRVADYKMYATVQTLLGEWRNKSPDVSVVAKFETELHSHLLKEKKLENLEELKTTDANNLVVDIMRKKLEEKFGSHLSGHSDVSSSRVCGFFGDDEKGFLSKLS